MKVINLFAGPGAGKSTTAAGLFALMKQRSHKVELVTEFAKDLTYEKNFGTRANQLAVLGEQDRRLRSLAHSVDFAITDSPLLLGLVYAAGDFSALWFHAAVRGAFDCYDNRNFYIRRVKPYQGYGRDQSECRAKTLDHAVEALLKHSAGTAFSYVNGDHLAAPTIYRQISNGA